MSRFIWTDEHRYVNADYVRLVVPVVEGEDRYSLRDANGKQLGTIKDTLCLVGAFVPSPPGYIALWRNVDDDVIEAVIIAWRVFPADEFADPEPVAVGAGNIPHAYQLPDGSVIAGPDRYASRADWMSVKPPKST